MENPVSIQSCPTGTVRLIAGVFWIFLAAAVMLGLLILLLPHQVFLAISNYLQILAALAGALALYFVYIRCSCHNVLPYAAGALALWGISDIAWYINVAVGLRAEVFPSLIDMGIIASILVLMIAYQNGMPRNPCSARVLTGILVISLLIPAAIILTRGFTVQTLVTFMYFFACGSLVITALNRGIGKQPHLLAGTGLFALAFMIYPIREMFFPANPFLSVIGTFVTAGLALIVIGLVQVAGQATET